MQIWIATNNRDVPRVMKTKFPATVMVFGVVSSEGHIRLESQHRNVPGCAEVCGDPLVQSGGWWQTLAETAGLGAGPQVHRPRLGIGRSATILYPSFTGAPPPSTWTRWTTSFGQTSRTSLTLTPTTPKLAWSQGSHRVFVELPSALVEKACSQFSNCIEAVIEAEGGYIE